MIEFLAKAGMFWAASTVTRGIVHAVMDPPPVTVEKNPVVIVARMSVGFAICDVLAVIEAGHYGYHRALELKRAWDGFLESFPPDPEAFVDLQTLPRRRTNNADVAVIMSPEGYDAH